MMLLVCKDVRPEYIRTFEGSQDGSGETQDRASDDVSSSNWASLAQIGL